MRANSHNTFPHRTNQQGVTLLLALVFLLIITVLAISSMREVALEARITGNVVENKRLMGEAESALRDGERRTVERGPQEPVADCTDIDPKKLCLLGDEPTYAVSAADRQTYSPNDGTTQKNTTEWYALIAPAGENLGQSENPEYGNMMLGIGIFRYEVNGVAESTNMKTAIRSTVALNSKGLIESN